MHPVGCFKLSQKQNLQLTTSSKSIERKQQLGQIKLPQLTPKSTSPTLRIVKHSTAQLIGTPTQTSPSRQLQRYLNPINKPKTFKYPSPQTQRGSQTLMRPSKFKDQTSAEKAIHSPNCSIQAESDNSEEAVIWDETEKEIRIQDQLEEFSQEEQFVLLHKYRFQKMTKLQYLQQNNIFRAENSNHSNFLANLPMVNHRIHKLLRDKEFMKKNLGEEVQEVTQRLRQITL